MYVYLFYNAYIHGFVCGKAQQSKGKKSRNNGIALEAQGSLLTGALALQEHGVLASRGEGIQHQGLESQD